MLTSWSEQLTPATLSIASVLIRPPASAYSIRAALGEAEVAALADDAAAQLAAVDADAVVGLVADVGVRLGGRLHVGADAAVPEQVDGRAQDRADQLVGRQLLGLDRRAPRWTCGESGIDFARARVHAAARRRSAPRRSRSRPSAAASNRRSRSAKLASRVGVGIEEHVRVVERGDQLDVAREQHPVAEHVARHVADPDDGEVGRLDVGAELAEVALDRLPRAARGDPHRACGRSPCEPPEANASPSQKP